MRMIQGGFASWPLHLFDAVDSFRGPCGVEIVQAPPVLGLDARLGALIASTVESLCDEASAGSPSWCRGVEPLDRPWFVSGVENLKASALIESSAFYRRRNIFVLANFLERA